MLFADEDVSYTVLVLDPLVPNAVSGGIWIFHNFCYNMDDNRQVFFVVFLFPLFSSWICTCISK